MISKKLISLFHMNVFPRVVSILSQKLFLIKLQQINLHRQKFTKWNTASVPQHLLSRMLSIIFRFSCFFQQVWWSHFNVLSHRIEPSSGIECILSLKFPTMQMFQMPIVTNCFRIMLLLFTTYRKVSSQ